VHWWISRWNIDSHLQQDYAVASWYKVNNAFVEQQRELQLVNMATHYIRDLLIQCIMHIEVNKLEITYSSMWYSCWTSSFQKTWIFRKDLEGSN
jgi:hypothetical protein